MASIHILPPETARLIAAGEVIDRPASALRELIDNAIDSGAAEIQVELDKGGIDFLRVSDNGRGMGREDLSLSILDHATSKIASADDLLRATTLGFRGEALASIAAVARLEIISREKGSDVGWRLFKEAGGEASIEPVSAREGTTVTVRGLFERFPARRQFLKRPASESALCRQIFVERAAAHPGVAFVWDAGGAGERYPQASPEERIALLHRELPSALLSRFDIEVAGARLSVIYADPAFHWKDRKYLQVFVNRRRVPEWGFLGLLEYAFADYLPGGMKPCAFLFAEIDPSQADFNIHPAKREVRLKNPEPIKSGFYAAFKTHLRSTLGPGSTDLSAQGTGAFEPALPGIGETAGSPSAPLGGRAGASQSPWASFPPRDDRAFWTRLAEERSSGAAWAGETPAAGGPGSPAGNAGGGARDESPRPGAAASRASSDFSYLGWAFGPFLAFARGEELFILDQHAAHERILFDELSAAEGASQSLLVPFVFEGGAGAAERVSGALPELARMGYRVEPSGDDFVLSAVPAFLGERGIQAFVDCFSESWRGEDLAKGLVATMACRAAVKDGDRLDDAAARDLIRRALELPFPRCPHGRPIWARLDRAALYRMVGRTVS
ncbi:DNA mismatch repair endonuclease MutL, partial [bacterium]|nr:DNA mismatch repair endonuclease MutL [bacterium]